MEMDMSLEEFGAAVDDYLGREVGFDRAVQALAKARARKAELKAWRGAAYAVIAGHRPNEETSVVATPTTTWKLTRVRTPAKTSVKLDSAAVRRTHPREYEAARILRPRVAVSAPVEVRTNQRALTVPPTAKVFRAVEVYTEIGHRLAKVVNEEKAARETLLEIAEACGWDGTERVFADGWKAATTALVFDAGRFADAYPDLAERYSRPVTTAASERVVLSVASADDMDAYAE